MLQRGSGCCPPAYPLEEQRLGVHISPVCVLVSVCLLGVGVGCAVAD